jgi:hypothetical protein
MQNKHPIAYISKALGLKQQAMSIYERELLAIVYAIQKWSTYLAYQLELPSDAEIHNVFHVSQLKLCVNSPFAQVHPLPTTTNNSTLSREPESILERKMVKRGRTAATKVLVQWKGEPTSQATWEFYYDLLKQYPNFHT